MPNGPKYGEHRIHTGETSSEQGDDEESDDDDLTEAEKEDKKRIKAAQALKGK